MGLSAHVAKETTCSCGCGGKLYALSDQPKTGIKEQDILDDLANEAFAVPDFNAQLDPIMKRAVAVIMACNSYEEAAEKLAESYPDLVSEEYERYLSNALFLADLLGIANAES